MDNHISSAAPCLLVRPPPAHKRHRPAKAGRSLKTGRMSRDTYKIAPRISYLDRAIVRAHFNEPPESCILAQRPRVTEHRHWHHQGQLPPDLHTSLLPAELEQKLSVLPLGYERVTVNADLLLVETGTRTVIDAVYSAGRHD